MTRSEQETESIFWAALAIESPEERARHLNEVCGDLPVLRDVIDITTWDSFLA